ncbi:DEAD/DEAH box helicase family protein [Oscillibacter sp.]|uniref:DEAD/DEAH box helicase family protein n=1 Tax=Oscillibacter sp. TaxID=1945593 RepID=UPI002D7EF54A|nr:DEAD/DEAH box helicase family protein [Oscillibacter sp.]
MTNFDHLLPDPDFASFAPAAAAAEKIYQISPADCILACRRCLEAAVKWMYSVDAGLTLPCDTRLAALMDGGDFRDIVGPDLHTRLKLIRRLGNQAAHNNVNRLKAPEAALCLENLYLFLDFVSYCYGRDYIERPFDPSLLNAKPDPAPVPPAPEVDLEALIEENKTLKAQLTARREEQLPTYVPKPLDLSEYETRKIYIDAMLLDAGWTEGVDWLNEVPVNGMPGKSGEGRADYVLYGGDGKPLAVLEAKRACADAAQGRQQAKLYADCLERRYGRRPVVFLSNGFETRIIDGQYPERKVAGVYSRRDLEKLMNLRSMRRSLSGAEVSKSIAGRYYQEGAVKAVCEAFGQKNRRKALLVMATGSGKTRTVIALCDVLLRHGWVKNILFLADRNSLVTQAKRNFAKLLPDLSLVNLCEEKDHYAAHCVLSTYQTMMNCIDAAADEAGKLFTCGHFDLVICDEAHRSIYNKYKDIFTYFDAPLVGLTATPKDEIEKNTYEIFELENGVPTYGYDLAQAVKDRFLVDFLSVETGLKFLERGIVYDELSEEDRAAYEETFSRDGDAPDSISSSALNEWVFNEDTIRRALHILMTNGLKVDYGGKLGKTIIFAKNHDHAEKILEVFGKAYPELPGFAAVIDNRTEYAQAAIDEFSEAKKLPQIAVSVDMLDTGIDVPEILNLVFFKKVMSRAKFWQMIGRGTRLCPGLIDGADKQKFYIFDFCGNFEFFRMNKGNASPSQMALPGALFKLKAQIALQLQEPEFQTEELTAFRAALAADMVRKVNELNRENFAVRQHLKYVERFSRPEGCAALTYEDTLRIEEELCPLIQPDPEDPKALRFDALLYGLELALLAKKPCGRARRDLLGKVRALTKLSNIPVVAARSDLMDKLLHTNYLETAGACELERIREELRDLMKYIPVERLRYDTNFDDEILSMEWKEAELENDDLKNYKAKAAFYVRRHQDEAAIAKLRGNVPLTEEDVAALERILWSEVGTKQDYEAELGAKPLGEFVREIVGLDMGAAKAAFAEYLDGAGLNSRQIYFVNQIVEYIVHNGLMKDLSVLQGPPFTDRGSVVEVFTDLSVWLGIRKVIERINQNALA